eukprot:GFUD01014723.1.p1 GENE.GFUD01014723.1~~GFUD01014723.1.p1  ORF type:complete len:596 (+),score=126.01 GFUD01014723.1:60-1847(+)
MEARNTENNIPGAMQEKESVQHKKRAATVLSIECGVCSSPAPDHLHFGARCCYSCRAFFRRTAYPSESLRCRSSLGKCEISSKNKKCISCRYAKCLQIGMAPELVQGTRNEHKKYEQEKKDAKWTREGLEKTTEHDITETVASRTNGLDTKDKRTTIYQPINVSDVGYFSTPKEKYRNTGVNIDALQKPKPYQTSLFDQSYIAKEKSAKMGKKETNDQQFLYNQDSTHPGPHISKNQQNSQFPLNTFQFGLPSSFSSQYYPTRRKYQPEETPKHAERFSTNSLHHANIRRMAATEDLQQCNNKPNTYVQYGYKASHDVTKIMTAKHDYFPPGDGLTDLCYKQSSKRVANMFQNPLQNLSSHTQIPDTSFQRTSVIKSGFSSKDKEPTQLQFEADMLKFQGNILQHTGNLFSYHAHLLQKERKKLEEESFIQKLEDNFPIPTKKIKKEDFGYDESEIKHEFTPQNFEMKEKETTKKDLSEALADQMFLEAQDLLMNSPWITTIDPSIDKELSLNTETVNQDVGGAKIIKTENVLNTTTRNMDWLTLPSLNVPNIDSITDLQFTKDELPTDISAIHNFSRYEPQTYTSVIQRPGLFN